MINCDLVLRQYHQASILLSPSAKSALKAGRNRVRLRIKRRLATFGFLQPIGFYGQGSVAMSTVVRDPDWGYDIDDGVYFERRAFVGPRGAEMSARAARDLIWEAAHREGFVDEPQMRRNCVRIYYAAGFSIDVPVYRVTRQGIFTPPVIELASTDWKRSDPRAVTRWFRAANARSPGFGTYRQLARIVRYVKAWVRARPAWRGRILGGFGITRLVVECYCPRSGRDDRALYETLARLRARLHMSLLIDHPVIQNEQICPPPSDAPVRYLRDQLDGQLGRIAYLPSTRNREDAFHAWDDFFRSDFFWRRAFPIIRLI